MLWIDTNQGTMNLGNTAYSQATYSQAIWRAAKPNREAVDLDAEGVLEQGHDGSELRVASAQAAVRT